MQGDGTLGEGGHGLEDQRASWLLDGQEQCLHCAHAYVLQMAYWCTDCDQPICPLCVVEVHGRKEVWCRACHDARQSACD